MKLKEESLNESLVESLIGMYINVPVNEHETADGNKENIWFAGQVAGYAKEVFSFNPQDRTFGEPTTYFNLIMTDGKGYLLAEDSEIEAITLEQFQEMVAEHVANQAMEEEIDAQVSKITQPEMKLLVPGVDF